VSESGLSSPDDLKYLHQEGIHAALIGEYFMRQANPGQALKIMKKELENLIIQ
jgi:indole-3-glycerol phosphate synthase